MPPKFIQIAVSSESDNYFTSVYGLGEDGTVWAFVDSSEPGDRGWVQLEGMRKTGVGEVEVAQEATK